MIQIPKKNHSEKKKHINIYMDVPPAQIRNGPFLQITFLLSPSFLLAYFSRPSFSPCSDHVLRLRWHFSLIKAIAPSYRGAGGGGRVIENGLFSK